jgi:pimeloyl-ACP methyl ester carboxylesterase
MDAVLPGCSGLAPANRSVAPAIRASFCSGVTPIWGRNDPFFIPPGAEAYRRDNPNATVRLLDTGHFALETHVDERAVG